MQAKDVMTREVLTIAPGTSLADAARRLLEHRISSLPVVDAEGRLVGILSEADLLHRSEMGTKPKHAWWQVFSLDPDEHAAEFLRVHGLEAGHVMTRHVVTVKEEAALAEV